MRKHTGEAPYRCPFPDCGRHGQKEGFSVRSNRKRHIKYCHAGREVPPYPEDVQTPTAEEPVDPDPGEDEDGE
jgi:hypothetical protein